MSERVHVELGDRAHDIHVGAGLLDAVGELANLPESASDVAVVSQRPVLDLFGDRLVASLEGTGRTVHVLEVPDGESAKDLAVLGTLWDRAAAIPLGRGDAVVALGGGVVGDLAGFMAATWNRGIGVVQVPTTLLAQVDAAIGGKTAVNLAAGKNLVGAFHQPLAVVCDVTLLADLPPRVFTEGLAEIVKYGFIRDPDICTILEDGAPAPDDEDTLVELVARSARVKADIVEADERESGVRAHLNLGHTYGHAIETLTGYGEVLHGEAVAMGTAVALELGVLLGLAGDDFRDWGIDLLRLLGLPVAPPALDRAKAWEVMERDKKATSEGIRFVVLEEAGTPVVVTPDRAAVDEAITNAEARHG
ncbi:MAG: 3-dehydroquinate synthase [Nitriliruptorales bacterium]|nr:3-dehydroquinate synthase [Nitriliruptorales bacterium]